jgi:uncharacterized protein (TIGR02996 family)
MILTRQPPDEHGRVAITDVDGNDHASWLACICERPTEDGPRLVYADQLEEWGHADRAEFIRIQIEIAIWGTCPGSPHGPPGSPPPIGCVCASRGLTRTRERAILWPDGKPRDGRSWFPMPASVDWFFKCRGGGRDYGRPTAHVCRGFVESLTVPWSAWRDGADEILDINPVNAVTLTTQPNLFDDFELSDDLQNWRFKGRHKWHERILRPPNAVESCLRAEWPTLTITLPPQTMRANEAFGMSAAQRFIADGPITAEMLRTS